MPTKRRRHLITESDDVLAALEVAAARWPEEAGSRSKLLVRLVAEGRRALDAEIGGATLHRREAVLRTSGMLEGAYGPGYLDELREDWPE